MVDPTERRGPPEGTSGCPIGCDDPECVFCGSTHPDNIPNDADLTALREKYEDLYVREVVRLIDQLKHLIDCTKAADVAKAALLERLEAAEANVTLLCKEGKKQQAHVRYTWNNAIDECADWVHDLPLIAGLDGPAGLAIKDTIEVGLRELKET